ncbi:hypothetical protein [Paenibacillus sp. YN15]|uniref:hypothetical protein n=1 Tax=Paenibacillus sp. YN15 TaxID=1742774 RepID=UPI000DCB9366|nr:hypothetical protein [Paenibacillus sp. YN15]RAU96792.1 hypothetical protein DQG13_19740 [Paenibacillus sp. YN15]
MARKIRFHLTRSDTLEVSAKKFTDVDKAFDARDKLEAKTGAIWHVVAETSLGDWTVFPSERGNWR